MESVQRIDLKARRQRAEELSDYIVKAGVFRLHIDPPMAAEMLGLAGSNRNVSTDVVERYADDIRKGQWILNGETIKFNDEGELLDGQHRLHAVVSAGIAIESLVVFGIDRSAMPTIDVGMKRTLAHAVSINMGYGNPTRLSAVASLLYRYQIGNLGVSGRRAMMSHTEGLRVISENPGLLASCDYGGRHGLRSLITPSIGAFCHFILSRRDSKKAEEFFSKLASGAGLEQTSPILHLRNFLVNQKSARAKVSQDVYVAYIFKAWLAFYEGRQMRQLSYKENEKFPVVE